MALPDTRVSLIERLHDRNDAAAWVEFCTIYERTIYGIARKYGLQDADAREVSQEVLLAVSRRISSFSTQRQGRFRGWLSTVARNVTIDLLRKNRKLTTLGDHQAALQIPGAKAHETELFDLEARRELFRWATEHVRAVVAEKSWSAFWLTAVEGQDAEQTAIELQMSVGAVYVARCRVLTKIKVMVQSFEEESP